MATYILGISGLYHDSAACIVKDGEIVAAAHEERFTRKKHDASFPNQAIAYCLTEAGITQAELDYVAFYEKSIVKFDRILQTAIYAAPWGLKPFMMAIPQWLKERLWMPVIINKHLPDFTGTVVYPTHHESHAASAFFPSPFAEAAILTLDAVGEWNTSSYGVGKDNQIELTHAIDFPHSLGMLYSAFTYYCGFKVNSGEYKLMGLAPYGEAKYVAEIKEHLIDIKADGSFRLNMRYFGYAHSLFMTNRRFHALFGRDPRKPEDTLEQFHMDLAASIQVVTEEIVLKIAKHIRAETGVKNLCMAGGVALNCVANGRLERAGIFDKIWVQPAAGDSGGAVGSALFVWYQHLKKERTVSKRQDEMQGGYLGPAFSDEEIETFLKSVNATYQRYADDSYAKEVAQLLASEKVIGWFQGRMEYGPRALGARSIIGDPRSREMQSTMNLKIKFRESFRPFAPSIMEEYAGEYFVGATRSPYMLFTYDVTPEHVISVDSSKTGLDLLNEVRSDIPAITHVDYSARIQTVSAETNPRYHNLIAAFKNITGCPVVINTSFNIRGEPIVCTPKDAWECFENTEMDYLAIGSFIVEKKNQKSQEEMEAWADRYEKD